jgi:hypothetical protein
MQEYEVKIEAKGLKAAKLTVFANDETSAASQAKFDYPPRFWGREVTATVRPVSKEEAEAAWQNYLAKEAAKLAKFEATQKAAGYIYKLDAWIHPTRGGDDYQTSLYSPKPWTPEMIAKALRSSSVKNDYTLSTL